VKGYVYGHLESQEDSRFELTQVSGVKVHGQCIQSLFQRKIISQIKRQLKNNRPSNGTAAGFPGKWVAVPQT
jgi:hypothetical protein